MTIYNVLELIEFFLDNLNSETKDRLIEISMRRESKYQNKSNICHWCQTVSRH